MHYQCICILTSKLKLQTTTPPNISTTILATLSSLHVVPMRVENVCKIRTQLQLHQKNKTHSTSCLISYKNLSRIKYKCSHTPTQITRKRHVQHSTYKKSRLKNTNTHIVLSCNIISNILTEKHADR